METEKFRISVKSRPGRITSTTDVDFTGFNAFIQYLEDNGITRISLIFYTYFDDDLRYCNNCSDLEIKNLTESHFKWLTEEAEGESRSLLIESQSSKPVLLPENMMHFSLMPFREQQLMKYFPADSQEKHLNYFKMSIERYKEYEDNKGNFLKENYVTYRQAEKDERFFTTRTFVDLFERQERDRNKILKKLLVNAFGQVPPFEKNNKYPLSWDIHLARKINLCFEMDLPAPKEYLDYLSINLRKRHFVPYVLDKAVLNDNPLKFRKDLEGSTQIDAYISGESGLKILIEAKYLSDISYMVSYDVTRNQLARNIDVMLEDAKGKSLFLLVTPRYFKENPYTRLYGYKMNDYLDNPLTLMADLCHRKNLDPADWKHITERMAWITWEDINEVMKNG